MKKALDETNRRRAIQEAYNTEHGITPESIMRPLDMTLAGIVAADAFGVVADSLVARHGAAVLEASLLAPELVFRAPAIVAVTGAEVAPKINGEGRPRNKSFAVRAGDRLAFDFMKAGERSYIAIAGGIDVPIVIGSRSTYGLGALGGFSGRKLMAGDVVPVGTAKPAARAGRALPADLTPTYPKSLELRVVTGLYFHRLTEEAAKTFIADTWTVAPEADRIGYRYRNFRRPGCSRGGQLTSDNAKGNHVVGFQMNRIDADWYFCGLRCALDCRDCPSLIAAYDFEASVNHHLRCVNAPKAKLARISALPFAVFMRGVGILPPDMVPIVHVLAENDELRAAYGLGSVQPFQ